MKCLILQKTVLPHPWAVLVAHHLIRSHLYCTHLSLQILIRQYLRGHDKTLEPIEIEILTHSSCWLVIAGESCTRGAMLAVRSMV